jgi:hypothetical protein
MKQFFISAWAKVAGVSRVLVDLVAPLFAAGLAGLLAGIAPIATDVVMSLADEPIAGADKRALAVDRIKALAVEQGIQTTASAVNIAIELAVAKLKASRS